MTDKLLAIWRFVIAMLLYPLAFAGLIWIAWTGKPVWWGVLALVAVLVLDRSWWLVVRGSHDLIKKKRPRRKPPGR